MSRRAVSLPLRLASSTKQQSQQWTCHRCLATQAEPTPTPNYDPTLKSSQRWNAETGEVAYRLKKSDRLLKKALPQIIPLQYLQHSTSELLPETEKAQRARVAATVGSHKKTVGVVVSAGKMDKTVKVHVPGQRWEPRLGKMFASHTNHLVHDPNSSLVAGDVVSLHRLRVSKAVHHVVAAIEAPFGKPVSERPPIPTPDERLAEYKEHRFAKLKRRHLRRAAAQGNADAIRQLKEMGLDPGDGVEAGKGEKANLQPNIGKTRENGKGAILGEKGQKLPKGVLPGGKHEVGKIDERAKHNKGRAMKMNEKAEENISEAKEKGEELEQESVGADPESSATLPRGRVD